MQYINTKIRFVTAASMLAAGMLSTGAMAQETIKMGLSIPLSGAGAVWGKGIEFMCAKAAQEVKEGGGVKVKGKTYNFECVGYDNKFNASEGTKVAQTLMNRENVKFIYGFGTAAILATQSLSERQNVMLFNTSWGKSSKGPQFPLTFQVNNTPVEVMPAMAKYITDTHPQAKTIALINVNDASGREAESVYKPTWEKLGIKVLTSDFIERGTTEFQPVAARVAAMKPDIVDVGSMSPAEAGQIYKELEVAGYKGIKVATNGNSAESMKATGGNAANGTYVGFAMVYDSPMASDHQRKVNEEARKATGESLGMAVMGAYDMIYMMKSAMEKAGSVDPKDLAAIMSSIKFRTFLGGETGFGGKESYGVNIAPILPVYISQVVDGKLVAKARIEPKKN
jgi:branched-chain amino acid transport system substrate-binding protein